MPILRVLCVFGTLNRGGAETMCMNLFRNIDRSKVVFDFVKHTPAKCDYEDEIITLGGKIYTAPPFNVYNFLSYCKWWQNFLTHHDEYKIVHSHTLSTAGCSLHVAHHMGCITIIHAHSTGVRGSGMAATIKKYLAKKSFSDADYRFACSEAAGKWLYKKETFTVINNAVDSALFAYDYARRAVMRDRLSISENEQAIFVVATLTKVKNPKGTIDIFNTIKKKMPTARLFWVGDGGMRTELQEKITAEGLSDCVTLLGARGDVADILQAADTFMLCSFREGLPVVTIEAQASGLSCLLSSAITTEADITGLCRFLPIDQPEAWADAMSELINIPRTDTSEQIKAAGYDIKTTSAWLTDFYLNCARK